MTISERSRRAREEPIDLYNEKKNRPEIFGLVITNVIDQKSREKNITNLDPL